MNKKVKRLNYKLVLGVAKKNIFICFLNQKYNKITIKVEKNNSALE